MGVFEVYTSLYGRYHDGVNDSNHDMLANLRSIYIIGLIILVTTSLPVSLSHGAGLPGLIVAMFIVGLGVGGVKATIGPFIGINPGQQNLSVADG